MSQAPLLLVHVIPALAAVVALLQPLSGDLSVLASDGRAIQAGAGSGSLAITQAGVEADGTNLSVDVGVTSCRRFTVLTLRRVDVVACRCNVIVYKK